MQKADRILACIPRNVGSRAREGTVPSALFLRDPTCSAEHSSEAPSPRRTQNCWSKSIRPNAGKRTGAPPLQRGAEKVEAVQPGEGRLSGDLMGT